MNKPRKQGKGHPKRPVIREDGWKDCQFPSFQIGPPRISINPWQFEGFLTPAGEYGRITTRRGA